MSAAEKDVQHVVRLVREVRHYGPDGCSVSRTESCEATVRSNRLLLNPAADCYYVPGEWRIAEVIAHEFVQAEVTTSDK